MAVDPVVVAMTTLGANITATLGSIAPIAIGIFAIFLGWRYGKRLFQTVAR